MVEVVQMERAGGPEVLRLADVALTSPGPGEIQVRHTAIGVNFVDIYFRNGLYQAPSLPAPLGVEAAGIVEAVGEGVIGFVPGERVGYAGLPLGGYAEFRNVLATRILKLPEEISPRLAAASLLRGLMHKCYLIASSRLNRAKRF